MKNAKNGTWICVSVRCLTDSICLLLPTFLYLVSLPLPFRSQLPPAHGFGGFLKPAPRALGLR